MKKISEDLPNCQIHEYLLDKPYRLKKMHTFLELNLTGDSTSSDWKRLSLENDYAQNLLRGIPLRPVLLISSGYTT